MEHVTGNFDRVAPVYDTLVRLVFGKAMRNAQLAFLNEIPSNSRVLMIGGGTGWLLAELLKRNRNCEIQYIDASGKMIEMAKRKTALLKGNVTFIHGTENDIAPGSSFDAIITHFYLDLFKQEDLDRVVRRIRNCCREGTLWLVCDFVDIRITHRALLTVMYWFFRVCANVRATKLPEWKTSVKSAGFHEIRSKSFYQCFISSTVFRLQSEHQETSADVLTAAS